MFFSHGLKEDWIAQGKIGFIGTDPLVHAGRAIVVDGSENFTLIAVDEEEPREIGDYYCSPARFTAEEFICASNPDDALYLIRWEDGSTREVENFSAKTVESISVGNRLVAINYLDEEVIHLYDKKNFRKSRQSQEL